VIELKSKNEEILEISKSKTTFFAAMSHELRNPLNALLGSLDLLEDSDSNEIISTAKICGDTLVHLIGNILDVGKIDSNKLMLLNEPACLKDCLQKITKMEKTVAQNKGLFLSLKIQSSIPDFLVFDVQKLSQIIINIVANAIKFTQNGRILINANWLPFTFSNPEKEASLIKQLLNHSSREEFFNSVEGKSNSIQ
jgi:signal transduction histidine kinase